MRRGRVVRETGRAAGNVDAPPVYCRRASCAPEERTARRGRRRASRSFAGDHVPRPRAAMGLGCPIAHTRAGIRLGSRCGVHGRGVRGGRWRVHCVCARSRCPRQGHDRNHQAGRTIARAALWFLRRVRKPRDQENSGGHESARVSIRQPGRRPPRIMSGLAVGSHSRRRLPGNIPARSFTRRRLWRPSVRKVLGVVIGVT